MWGYHNGFIHSFIYVGLFGSSLFSETLQRRYQCTSWSFQLRTQKGNNKSAKSKHFLLYYRLPHFSLPWLCECSLSPEEYKHACFPLLVTSLLRVQTMRGWGIVAWGVRRNKRVGKGYITRWLAKHSRELDLILRTHWKVFIRRMSWSVFP